MKPAAGKILISDPFLRDPNFARTIVFLTEHTENGSFGFVLNNAVDITLKEVFEDDALPTTSLFQGGPVELNTLHFLHAMGNIIENSKEVIPGVWWGGDFNKALEILKKSPDLISHFVFFVGYSGWGAGQLDGELQEEAWVVSDIGSAMVFNTQFDAQELWKKAMKNLGGKYNYLAESPIDPQLN
ncbi:MAG: YqgE/AlgH family protein [Bacteroidia bacterium]|nr:YqgE/AlgH family protein [Bacteroidia bacterium]